MKVALIGLDGSGKSTNIELMKKDLDYNQFQFLWVRWQPSITVLLYKMIHWNDKGKIGENNAKCTKRQIDLNKNYQRKKHIKTKVFGLPIIRKIWFTYALSDYRKQFLKKTQSYLDKDTDIIFDRYYLDLFIDQGINFGYSPEKIYFEILKYKKDFPEIDKMIYIRVSPYSCFDRKNDIPNVEYLNSRYHVYEYLSKQEGWIVIDGENPLNEVYANIKKEIILRRH